MRLSGYDQPAGSDRPCRHVYLCIYSDTLADLSQVSGLSELIAKNCDQRGVIGKFLLSRAENTSPRAKGALCYLVNDTIRLGIVRCRIGHAAIDIAQQTWDHGIQIDE